jgi:hypothetical protein
MNDSFNDELKASVARMLANKDRAAYQRRLTRHGFVRTPHSNSQSIEMKLWRRMTPDEQRKQTELNKERNGRTHTD